MNEAPAIQIYPRDWLADVGIRLMDDATKAVFYELCWYCWSEDGLPNNPELLARLVGRDPEQFAQIWESLLPRFELVELDGRHVLYETRLLDKNLEYRADRAAKQAR